MRHSGRGTRGREVSVSAGSRLVTVVLAGIIALLALGVARDGSCQEKAVPCAADFVVSFWPQEPQVVPEQLQVMTGQSVRFHNYFGKEILVSFPDASSPFETLVTFKLQPGQSVCDTVRTDISFPPGENPTVEFSYVVKEKRDNPKPGDEWEQLTAQPRIIVRPSSSS